MWREKTFGRYQDQSMYGSANAPIQSKRKVFDNSDDVVSPTKTEKFSRHKGHGSFESSSQNYRKKPKTFDDDESGGEFGYSKGEQLKLKAARSSKYDSANALIQNKRIVFDNSDDEVSPINTANFSKHKGHGSFESSSQNYRKKKPKTFDDDESDGEFGYSKAKQFKLKGARSSKSSNISNDKRKPITPDDTESASDLHTESETTDSDSEDELEESDSEKSENDDKLEDYSEMTMEELLSLQETMGVRAFREKVLKVQKSDDDRKPDANTEFKRLNKNRPREMPLMRKTAPRMRFLEPGKKAKKKFSRDPRFDDLSGNMRMHLWNKNYQFLKDARMKEMDVLQEELKKEDNPYKKQKMKLTLQRMKNQKKDCARRDQEQALKQLERKQQREALKQGEKPKFMSEKDKKMLLKTMHFEQLKKDNKVGKYLERKEKKQLKREKKMSII